MARVARQTESQPDVSIRRTLFVAAFVAFWMVGIGARLVHLQVTKHEKLVARAHQQQQDAIETSPTRGPLLDRGERELARTIDTTSVFIAPDEFKKHKDDTDAEVVAAIGSTSQSLSSLLGLDQKEVFSQISEARNSGRRFLWIARRITPDKAEALEKMELAGVHTRKEPKRFYPNGSLAANVLGFVGLDGKGLAGIEQVYNEKIIGEPGKIFIEKDSLGRAYESTEVTGRPGQTIVLTIDQSIQYQAEAALTTAIEQSGAKAGTAIVLDPHNGDILALANSPTFDPNDVGAASPAARANWALQNIYEPGSTFKVVAFSAAIEKGLAKPDDHIDCQMGSITVAKRVIHDHKPFGDLTLTDALAKSSNVAAIKLGLRVGDPTMYEFITRFGFGSRTGIELPGETAGIVRPLSRWQPSSIGSIAMGQEVGVTPLQMVAAFGALANDGVRIAPHLIREIRNENGVSTYRPNPEQHRVISRETARALRGMLEGVTLNGTAKKAQLDGYTAAGKTGTAQKIDPKTRAYSATKFVASFVGFAPVNNPAVVIIVVIDEPSGAYHGGDVAAPVFRQIAEQILPEMGVIPDTAFSNPQLVALAAQTPAEISQQRQEEKRRENEVRQEQTRESTMPRVAARDNRGGEIVYAVATDKAILMPDLRGRSVRDVARACAQLGMQVEGRGEGGRVVGQTPQAGSALRPGQMVYVDFGRLN
ncbi:MAG TPA: penicillin-binding transpeptidase domain-containing protein [Pyrinomonadaceae bacterium]|jgi:cell division protein FtsI (penicillin-binding protein 3)|nr:penicillin-binding transpeptidase domain-containing protein [Pyrinomonadaceae bacterium]